MVIKQLIINNFRCIKTADLRFKDNTLLVGTNNVGKSTILEALDLAIGPNRLVSSDAINEHDFHNSSYLDENENPIKITIEVRLTNLNDTQKRVFSQHLEYWDIQDDKYVSREQLGDNFDEDKNKLDCLRVVFEGYYDTEENDFLAQSSFLSPPPDDENSIPLTKSHKRDIGYLYLRTLRTGSRALSLEKGSLLDIILDLKGIGSTQWQKVLTDLSEMENHIDANSEFRSVLDQIEEKVKRYTPLNSGSEKSTKFEITDLTRRHLRQVMSLFVGTQPSNALVPYRSVGNGTINVFLFSLMSIIADLKRESNKSVIFAMEEPEIALPPYTQRRITEELCKISDQCFVTSHSPYVAERFIGKSILVLNHDNDNHLFGKEVDFESVKEKIMRMDFRKRFAEGLLSRGIVAVEGISDERVLYQCSTKLSQYISDYVPLDVDGIIVVGNSGSGGIDSIGTFFKNVGVKTYCFYDSGETIDASLFDIAQQQPYAGLEELLTEEIPISVLNKFIETCRTYTDFPGNISLDNITDVKAKVLEILKTKKGELYSEKLVSLCEGESELPTTIVDFLKKINGITT